MRNKVDENKIDAALYFAVTAAEAVKENFLQLPSKVKKIAIEAALQELRARRDGKPETLWIIMKSVAPDLKNWLELDHQTKKAVGAFRDILNAMDHAFEEEAKPEPPIPSPPKLPGRNILQRKKGSILTRTIFDR